MASCCMAAPHALRARTHTCTRTLVRTHMNTGTPIRIHLEPEQSPTLSPACLPSLMAMPRLACE